EFPLPLAGVSGTLDVRPDHWEFWDFVGRHKDGVIRASGRSQPVPQPVPAPPGQERPDRVALAIQGQGLPLDRAFEAALGKGREPPAPAWKTFALPGRMNFPPRIDDVPNQPQDIDVTVGVGGCRMNPSFFPYALEEVAATVRYAKGSAWVSDFHGRHGKT